MKFLPLLWATLWRKRTRTIFTLLSIVVAFLLFGMLQGVNSAFSAAVDRANVNRLITTSNISFTEPLPFADQAQIATVPGVANVTHESWFGAYFQDPKNFVFSYPIDATRFFDVVPEFKLPAAELDALQRTRTGAVIGRELATKYGWKIGDRVPLHSTIWTWRDGGSDWTFDVVGIYDDPTDPALANQFFFNYDYFDEGRAFGKGKVGWYLVRVDDPHRSAQIAQAIDKLFANSSDETETKSEKEFQQSFLKQIGDINFIVTRILVAVFLALLIATGSTMIQSINERTAELAVLKTLGFRDHSVLLLVLAESLLLCLLAAALGLGIAALLFPGLKNYVGVVRLPSAVVVEGVIAAAVLALLTGALPALRAMRLNIVDALAGR